MEKQKRDAAVKKLEVELKDEKQAEARRRREVTQERKRIAEEKKRLEEEKAKVCLVSLPHVSCPKFIFSSPY